MKKLVLLSIICLVGLVACQKSGYNCQQKVTTSMIPDSTGFPKIQFSEFQLQGSTNCIVGTTTTQTQINPYRVKVVKCETSCD